MGSRFWLKLPWCRGRLIVNCAPESNSATTPKMKAMKAKAVKAMPKGAIADTIAGATGLKKAECSKALDSLTQIAMKEVKKTGKFTIPGLVMIKTRQKPATKAGTREMFGKTVKVTAMKARTIVKALPLSALKKSI